MSFIHLHTHTEYSLLDGANKIKDYVAEVKALGMNSAAITDHGVMYGAIAFYKECKKQGINPILGCEVYVAPGSRFDKKGETGEKDYHHLVLLVENEQGYSNLCKLVSASFTEGFYRKPRVDNELLAKYSEGLICLSACLGGSIPQALLSNDYDKALSIATEYKNIFGKDNFFIEIQDHGINAQAATNPDLIRIAKELDLELVATNDVHYTKKEDAAVQDVLLCIQTGALVSSQDRMRFDGEEFYVKSEQEMRDLFPAFPDAIENTQKIADRCKFDFTFGEIRLPFYEIPEGFDTHFAYFKHLCDEGLKFRYGNDIPQEYIERLDYELSVIDRMGYIDYFLIVWDFINYARTQDIPVGPGRGSGAGSIAAYAVGITDIDPMRFNLLFERFLNPERISMPDFDIDFCYERRGEVIDYVVEKYGKNKVSQIVTYITMAARGSIKDVGKVLGYQFADVNRISKMIPEEVGMTIEKALEISSDFRAEYENNPMAKEIIDLAKKIEGMPKSTSKHAAGILICDKDIVEYAPLKIDDNGELVIQSTMTELEDLGLLKMDFLGLRTLTVIKDTEKSVAKAVDGFNIADIPLDDAATYKMLSAGDTFGVFQLESGGMQNMLTGLQPKSIEDITAGISLYRPGPMDSIPEFIQNKNNIESIHYDCDELRPIMDVTYGCLVYQEQVMKLFQDLAGFSLGRADIVRRAMSKKKADVLAKEQQIFIYGLKDDDGNVIVEGAKARGINEDVAAKIMDGMTSFAEYAFNKSHAACYAAIAYQTAYLKCHYPVEFTAALLSSVIGDKKLSGYCNATQKEMGISILPPSVNHSDVKFASTNGGISFALSGLKGVGETITTQIVDERTLNGDFKSVYDFCRRLSHTKLDKTAMGSLIKSGAFDFTGYNRREITDAYPMISAQVKSDVAVAATGQISLFDLMPEEDATKYKEPPIERKDEFAYKDILRLERESTNLFISGHPLDRYSKAIDLLNCDKIKDIVESVELKDGRYEVGQYVTVPVLLFNTAIKFSKKGNKLCIFKAQDEYSEVDGIAFSKCLDASGFLFSEDNCVIMKCKVELNDADKVQLVCMSAYGMPSNESEERNFDALKKAFPQRKEKQKAKTISQRQIKKTPADESPGFYIEVPTAAHADYIFQLVEDSPGATRVYVYCKEHNCFLTSENINFNLKNRDVLMKITQYVGPGKTKFI